MANTTINWDSSDWVQMKEKFDETQDFRYVVIALAMWPEYPLEWALAAAEALKESCIVAHNPILGPPRKGPKPHSHDIDSLEKMADLMSADLDMTPHGAAKKVLGDGLDDSNLRRLLRKWSQEELTQEVDNGELLKFHPRLERHMAMRAKASGKLLHSI